MKHQHQPAPGRPSHRSVCAWCGAALPDENRMKESSRMCRRCFHRMLGEIRPAQVNRDARAGRR